MAITVCYDELDSFRFSDTTFGEYSVYAVADEFGWLDAPASAITHAGMQQDLWHWSDSSTVNAPFDQIADAWRWGEAINTTQTTNALDAVQWQDSLQVTATVSTLDSWRFADGAQDMQFTVSHSDEWRWQDYSTGSINVDTLDAFGWSDQLSEPQTKGSTLDSWQFDDGVTLGESSLLLVDQWRWSDVATAPVGVTSLTDAWHWNDAPQNLHVTATGQLLDEFYWSDAPSTSKTHQAWVSHLRTFAASTWNNLPYSAYAGGVCAGKQGIYKAGTEYASSLLKTGWHDLGVPEQKTIGSVYAGTDSKGDTMALSVETDAQPVYTYPADTYGTGNARFKTGRGLRGRTIQLTVTGKSTVSELVVDLAATSRRAK